MSEHDTGFVRIEAGPFEGYFQHSMSRPNTWSVHQWVMGKNGAPKYTGAVATFTRGAGEPVVRRWKPHAKHTLIDGHPRASADCPVCGAERAASTTAREAYAKRRAAAKQA